MPTDGSGVYSLPAGYLGTTGLTIETSQHNPPLEDIAAALTARMPRTGTAPMTGVLRVIDGTVSAPGLALATATNWGLYKTANGIGVTVGGVHIAEFAASGLVLKDAGNTASANPLVLGVGNIFNVTGTTGFASIATKGVGSVVFVRFNGILTITHHATDLVLLGGVNITTAAGDQAVFEEYATGDWRMVAYHRANGTALQASMPRGYNSGCIVSNNAVDATNDIDITAGAWRESTNAANITCAAMTKKFDANWAAGTNQGLRNSAAGLTNTTYHIYAVSKVDGTQDYYAHTSLTVATVITALQAETGGADYIYARRIGSIVRVGDALALRTQIGDYFRFKTPTLDVEATITTSSALHTLASIPTGLSLHAKLNVYAQHNSVAPAIYIRHPDDTDTAPSITAAPLGSIRGTTAANPIGQVEVFTNTSAEIAARSENSSTTLRISPIGYFDRRGRDD